mgnify:CR=1 FL=1
MIFKRHGKGKLAWKNGDKYDGEWKDDKKYIYFENIFYICFS